MKKISKPTSSSIGAQEYSSEAQGLCVGSFALTRMPRSMSLLASLSGERWKTVPIEWLSDPAVRASLATSSAH